MKIDLSRRSTSAMSSWSAGAGFAVWSVTLPPRFSVPSAGLSEQHRKLPRPAHGAFRPGHFAGGIEPELRNALQPFLDGHRHFHARQIRTDAAVNAETERGV